MRPYKVKRETYKFSHSIVQGGYLYAHQTVENQIIPNKEGLKNMLKAVEKKFALIDVTIKIYDTIFFFFFMTKPSVIPQELIETIQTNLESIQCKWNSEFVYTGVYDLQELYLREELKKWGYEFDKGTRTNADLSNIND
ncbi:hypothetical protein CL622_04710 [archaeon]|nr:hypothetical protein [archaeon]|tara:strand:- start:62 stop:478 length:417 start_codon:yes stop_codon:yes gene_type:complete